MKIALALCTLMVSVVQLAKGWNYIGYRGSWPIYCTIQSGDGRGDGETKIGSQTGEACALACLNEPGVNGMTFHKDGDGCWCEKKMKEIRSSDTYKTCFFTRRYDCSSKVGDGMGESEFKIGAQKGYSRSHACAQACASLKLLDNSINGATWKRTGSRGCWCEQEMERIKPLSPSTSKYTSCFLS